MIIDKSKDTEYRSSVRSLLGIDRNDTVTLPDEDIDDPAIFDMAEMEIMSLLPDGVDLTDKRIRLAQIYYMAALLCPSMPSRVEIEVRGIDSGWKKKPIDYNELAEKLLAQVDSLLSPFTQDSGGESDIFRIAPSKRAVMERENIQGQVYPEVWGGC